MNAAGARVHLGSGQGSGEDSGGDPDGQVCSDVMCWIGQPGRLESRGQNCKNACGGEGERTVATELRRTGHLPANAADVAKRLVELVHKQFTLQCKVPWPAMLVNIQIGPNCSAFGLPSGAQC